MDRLRPDRVEEILASAAGVRALVVGDVMLDRYITGSVDRVSPEAPVPVVHVESESAAMGGAANVAANVVSLGGAADLVGCVGSDEHADALTASLAAAGVETEGLVISNNRPTTVKTRVLARHQQVVRVDREYSADVSDELRDDLVRRIGEMAERCQVLIVEDYNKGVLVPDVIRAVFDAADRWDVPTVVDPKQRRFSEYGGATVFKPNAKELSESLREEIHPDDPAWMERTRVALDCGALLLTLGEHGMALAGSDGTFVRVPAVARDIYDVSGAGDTVTAVVALSLAAGATLEEATILANHAAAIEVSHTGVVTVSGEEILEQVSRFAGI